MTVTLRILLVEDDNSQADSFKDAVNAWNAANIETGRRFTVETGNSVNTAQELLATHRFDCAFIDIRLPAKAGEKPKHSNGNDVINTLLLERGFPIGVISGNMSELDPAVVDKAHVCRFDKGDPDAAEKAVAWLAENWPMMAVLQNVRHVMEQAGAEIFGKRLWPRWSNLPSLDPKETAAIVARQYASHLVDKLGLDEPENIEWHPFEAYVSPSLNELKSQTGDILELEEGKLWVVLSPQCDMATKKIENAVLCLCYPNHPEWEGNVAKAGDASLTEAKRSDALGKIRKLTNQVMPVSEHFMPPLPGSASPLVVKFGALRTCSLADLNSPDWLAKRKASVSSPFLANLVQRFGAYMSRTGQPNLNPKAFLPAPVAPAG